MIKELPPKLTKHEAALELAAIEAEFGRRSLLGFIRYTKKDYLINWHHRVVAEALERVLTHQCRRLMIFMPPQNGKTEAVSRRFPAFVFGKNPDTRIIACSYNMAFAQSVSRDVQKIMSTNEYRRLFPDTHLAEVRYEKDPVTGRRTHQEKRTQGEFDIVGHRGSYTSAGIDGPIGGKSADLGIIDDPVKNRADAESEVYRDRIWNWYISTFSQRQFGSDGAIILCSTRWHTDDLAGRLLKLAADNPEADQWEVLTFPAIAEVADQYRQVDEPLWPVKYTLEELTRRKAGMGAYDWAALQQQQPAPSGGGLFKKEWFADKFVDAAPVVARRARGWDTAGTEGAGDWTCGVKIAEAVKKNEDGELVGSGIFYIEDVQRKQLLAHGVDQLIQTTAALDGKECAQREEKEVGSSGLAVIDARTKTLKGYDYAGVPITGSKVTRSKPFRVQCEAGNVYIVRDQGIGGSKGIGWNTEYVDELAGFPTAKHDDQVDGSSCAFNAVLLEPIPQEDKATWGRG